MRTQLLSHNKAAYQKVMRAFETSDRTCVVHPTGTGKSYLIAAVSESFKRVLILGPNTFVLDQVHQVLYWRDKTKEVDYMTYAMLTRRGTSLQYDLICLDEFHRAGAEEWGEAVMMLLSQQANAKVFGTTATPIRHLDGERDMSDEIFHGNVASTITIGEAWSRNILPIPTYVTGLFDFKRTVNEVADKIRESKYLSRTDKDARLKRLSIADEEWERSEGMPSVLRKHIDNDCRRVLVFCSDVETLRQMGSVVKGWFTSAGMEIYDVFYLHNEMTERQQRDAMEGFESDDGKGLRIMMSVDMLNEGIHVPRVGAVLMLRTTQSRIVFMQQMGRCLTAANTERPVILDMVDNIKNTSAIHEFKRDFDNAEILRVENDINEPKVRHFRIYDYTKTVSEVVKQLQSGVNGREYLSIEQIREQIRDFAAEHDRWPSHGAKATRYEKLLAHRFGNNRALLLADRDFNDLYEYYRQRDLPVFEEYYRTVLDYCKKYDRYPNGRGDTEEDRIACNCWIWLRKNFADDERVVAVQKNYSIRRLREDEIQRRIEELTSFANTHNRQPNGRFEGEGKLRGYLNQFRETYRDREDVQQLMALFDSKGNKPEPIGPVLSEYRDFCEKNKRIPRRFSKDPYEVSLYKRTRSRKTLRVNKEYIRLNEKYKHRRMDDDEEERIVREHCRLTGRRPSKATCSKEVYRAWSNIVRFNQALADEIRNKYPQSKIWSDADIERYAQEMIAFMNEHHRRPTARIEGEKRLCNILSTLLKKDHPLIDELKAVIASLPKSECHVKRFTQRQLVCRRGATNNHNYKIIPKNECTDDNRYVIFYTPETVRSKKFEDICISEGLEIREWTG